MSKEVREHVLLQRKLAVIHYAKEWNSIARACRTFGFSRSAYYRWIKIYEAAPGKIFTTSAGRTARITVKRHMKLLGVCWNELRVSRYIDNTTMSAAAHR